MQHFRIRFLFPLFCALAWAAPVEALTYSVGTGSGCTHSTVQSAINAAESSAGADTIRVTRSLAYTQQAISLTTSQSVDIVGGFATCTQATSDGSLTTIDGAGGATEPVFRITGNTGALVKLDLLNIRGGDEDGEGYGGGIYFKGNGILEISHSTITQNTAGYGGGIYAQGTGINAELVIGQGVQIIGNTARYSGGGVYNEGLEMTMIAPDSWIALNHAPGVLNTTTGQYVGGYAGGLMVLSGSLPAYAYIGSGGIGSSGPIYFNDARYGGGVAVVSHDTDAELRLFTIDPAKPVRIKSNSASVAGGGIYQQSDESGKPYVRTWFAWIEDNDAPHGAAAYLQGGHSSYLWFNKDSFSGAAPCPVGSACGGIVGNFAEDGAGQAVGGVVEVGGFGFSVFFRALMEGNSGKFLFRGDGAKVGGLGFETHHALITGNVVTSNLIASENDGENGAPVIQLNDTTIAGNAIGAQSVMRLRNGCEEFCNFVKRSIIWQPGKTTLQNPGTPLTYLSSIASEIGSLVGSAPEVIVTDPRFVDPARGDFSLRAGSPAVDAAATVASDTRDLYSNLRDVDLPFIENSRGPRDIGAIERPAIQPLVLNSELDSDLNHWYEITTGVSSWTNTQNAVGQSGSGSVYVTQSNLSNPLVVARAQCIHLPGPGRYLLNGYGRNVGAVVASRDDSRLLWELRHAGGEGCTGGAPNASGTHLLSRSTTFVRPANPAIIEITPDQWTYTSSITIYLAVNDNGLTGPPNNGASGWFDGITLELENGDVIFRNGFDP